jgi:SAM-dependent methyltransferase
MDPISFDYVAALYYDLMNPAFFEPEQIDFHLHYALRAKTALDIGAGTGRIAIPLAEHRVHVTAFDLFRGMLAALEIKLTARPELQPFITPVTGDPLTVDFKRQFGMAYMARVLFYICSDADRVQTFRNIARHLEPRGLFIVDAPIGTRPAQPRTQFSKTKMGRATYTVYNRFERQGGAHYKGLLNFEEHLDGVLLRTVDREFDGYDIPSKAYLTDLFNESGFVLEEAYSDLKFKPYPTTGDADYGIFVARKR